MHVFRPDSGNLSAPVLLTQNVVEWQDNRILVPGKHIW